MVATKPNSPLPTGDVLLAVAFIAVAQVEIWVFSAGDEFELGVRAAASVLVTVAGGALAWRRIKPSSAFWANSAAVLAAIAVGFPTDIYQWSNLVALYSVAAYGTSVQSWIALPAGIAGVGFYFLRLPGEGGSLIMGFAMALWLVGWLTGRTYGARLARETMRVERDLSLQIAATRQERIDLDEARSEIARELHDIIGHTVNVMVVHAGAGRGALAEDPKAALKAFEVIEETGRDALSQLDNVLALLRDDTGGRELAPPQGIEDIRVLVERAKDESLDVSLDIVGSGEAVPVSVGLATYRIVQEAITNVMKHADASHADISLDVGSNEVRIKVSDNGEGLPTGYKWSQGMAGMTERAALHGGEVLVGNGENGGTVVDAVLRWGGQP